MGVWNRKVRPLPGQFFQDHQEVVRGPHQQGVVIEGRVREAPSVLPVNQLGRNVLGPAPPVNRLQLPGGAVGAIQGAAPGSEDGDIRRVVQEVQGRIGQGVQVFEVREAWPGRRKTGDLLQDTQNGCFSRSGDHPVGAAVLLGVLRAQGGVDPPQDHGNLGKALPGQADGRGHPGVPVGHEGGHQDGRGGGDPGQARPEIRLTDAVAPVAPGDALKGRGRRDDLLGVAPGAERSGPGVGRAQAVQEVDRIPPGPKQPRQIEQPQRPGKKIVGREIVDPGVDQEEGGTGVGQGKDLLSRVAMNLT